VYEAMRCQMKFNEPFKKAVERGKEEANHIDRDI
jgi:hypothetical protein